MKAASEIGYFNTLVYLVYTIIDFFYHCMFLPPLRKLFLQFTGAKIGENAVVMSSKFINWHHLGPIGLSIGNDCFIGDEILIDLYDKVTFGSQVTVAQRVTILTHLNVGYLDHPLQKYFPKTSKGVVIGSGSVIGAGAVILPGVKIGEKSFIAAGSVVTKNVPANTLVAGVPARPVRKIHD